MAFNLQELKKLVYDVLTNDSTLVSLLGGQVNIFHFYPKQEKNIPYPIVVYSILGIQDNVYDTDLNAGVNKLTLSIDVFSDKSSTKEADDIADRIYFLLHAKSLSNTNIIAYTSYRVYQDETYEDSSQTWRINARYEIANAKK